MAHNLDTPDRTNVTSHPYVVVLTNENGPVLHRLNAPNTALFDTAAKNLADGLGDPSLTSGDHLWNGATANLNHKADWINSPPLLTGPNVEASNGIDSSRPRSSYDVVPKNPYLHDAPNKYSPDAKAPNLKYFNPASVEKADPRANDANPYSANDCNSNAR